MPLNRIRMTVVLASAAMATIARGTMAADYYVAPGGSDANPGTFQQPFATLHRAQQAARKSAGREAITIYIRQGTHYLPGPLILTQADSGTKETPVTYRAYGNEQVIVSGGTRLQDLKWEPYRNGIMQARVPPGFATDQLFVNGKAQVLARYPNYDSRVRIYHGYAADAFGPHRAAGWKDPAGGFIHAQHGAGWGGFHYAITGKRADNTVVYEGGWQNNRPMGMSNDRRFVENVFEELDAPGEWFLDAKQHMLYCYPPPGVDLASATVEGVRLRSVVEFHGTEKTPIRFVRFKKLEIRHAARTFMDTREPLLRSDWAICRAGAIFFEGSEDCALEDCTVRQVGGNAIFINNYNRRVAVRGCHIAEVGGSGIALIGDPAACRNPATWRQGNRIDKIDRAPGPKTNNYPADCLVEDCLIHDIGRVEKQTAGVTMDMAQGIAVRHCSIYDMPRAGINIGDGCWGGHLIEFCDVFDTVKETGDHGSFNSWGRDRYWGLAGIDWNNDQAWQANKALVTLDACKTTVIRNSRWRCDHGWDIDLDDGSTNYHIYNNLCLRGGLKNREGFYRIVENNVILETGYAFHVHCWFKHSGDVVRRNIMCGREYGSAANPQTPWGKEMDYNLVHNPGVTDPVPAATLASQSKRDEHSLMADARFVAPQQGDFRVQEGSPALKLGFVNFPMDQFGVRKPELKAIARTPQIPALSTAENPPKPGGALARAQAAAPDPYGILRQPIPGRLMVLTFDDGCLSHARLVAPLLKKYGFGGTFYVSDAFAFRTRKDWYMTWEQIKRLEDAGFEIGNHTIGHGQLSAGGVEGCIAAVTGLEELCRANRVARPVTFCWPFYSVNNPFCRVLHERGYLFARGGGERPYRPTLDCPLDVPSFTVHDASLKNKDSFANAAKQATPGQVVVFTFHGVPDGEHPGVGVEPAKFEELMKYLKENGYTVIALRDLARYVDAAKAAEVLSFPRTLPWGGRSPAWGGVTRRGDRLYLCVMRVPADRRLTVPGLTTRMARAHFLADRQKKPLEIARTDTGIQSIVVPQFSPAAFGENPTVIVAELAGGPVATILEFVFPGMPPATISGNQIRVRVPLAADLARLAPTYRTGSPQVVGSPPSGTVRDFRVPQTYTVTAPDGSARSYVVRVIPARGAVGVSNPSFEQFDALPEYDESVGRSPGGTTWTFKHSRPGDEVGITHLAGPITATPPAPDGTWHAAFIRGPGNGISQAVVFDEGKYTVSFDVAKRRGYSRVSTPLAVTVDGTRVLVLQPDDIRETWTRHTSPAFQVASGVHWLAFTLLDGDGMDMIDNVVVQPGAFGMTRWAKEVSPENVLPEYPRPQMVRKEWLNLNGLWKYAVVAKDETAPAAYQGDILVPFPIEAPLSGVGRKINDFPGRTYANSRIWYSRNFAVPGQWKGRRVLLHFGAVDWEATVFLNGRELGVHRGGYDGFSFDVTDSLKPQGANELVVAVWDPTCAGGYPRGKQVDKPGGIWYTPCSGIWQTVWLEPVPDRYLQTVRIVADVDASAARFTCHVAPGGPAQPSSVRIEILDEGKVVARATGRADEAVAVRIEAPKRWTPSSPHLYDFIVRTDADEVRGYFGLRKVSIGPDRHGVTRILLNNEFLPHNGVLDQGYWPDGIYTAPTDEALRYDIEMIKRLGFNMSRKHVKVEPDRWYYWCDKLGLLVWQDMPCSGDGIGTHEPAYPESKPRRQQQFGRELRALVEGRFNHPSVVMWIVFNEGMGLQNSRGAELDDDIRAFMRRMAGIAGEDKTRVVNAESGAPNGPLQGWNKYDIGIGQVMDAHCYGTTKCIAPTKDRASVIGEYGYARFSRTFDKYQRLIQTPGVSGLVWTQITDVEGERNGLLTYDRARFTEDPDKVQALNAGTAPDVVLFAEDATTAGGIRCEARNGESHLGYWTAPKATASWRVGFPKAGTYEIALEVASPYEGVTLCLEAAGQEVKASLPKTKSHDDYVVVPAGCLKIGAAETVVVKIRAAEPEKWRPVNLKEIRWKIKARAQGAGGQKSEVKSGDHSPRSRSLPSSPPSVSPSARATA